MKDFEKCKKIAHKPALKNNPWPSQAQACPLKGALNLQRAAPKPPEGGFKLKE
jgi:hypothetical protein